MSGVQGATQEPANAQPGAALFVWGTWAAMLLLAVFYVVKFGSRLPFYDDWALIPVLTGAEPFTPTYLWEPYHDHHMPLPKLVLYVLGRLSGCDFRPGLFLNVALLGVLAFGLLITARRLRGYSHFADAFFPLFILGLAQWECFLMASTLNHVGSTVILGTYLLLLAGSGPQVTPRRAVLMAGCLALLPLCGANGLAPVPPLALWLLVVVIRHCRTADAPTRRQGWLTLGLLGFVLLLCGLYILESRGPGPYPSRPAPEQLRSALQILDMLFGASDLPFAPLRASLVPGLLLAGGGVWLAAWWRRPEERLVLLGFLAFLLGMGCLVGAIAWGRGDYVGTTGLVPRYATLLLPLGCCLYFLWGRHGGVTGAPVGQMALLLLAGVMFAPNLRAAVDNGRSRRLALRTFEADLAAHVPPALLAERGAGRVYWADGMDYFPQCIRRLRDAGAGPFRGLPADSPLHVVPLPASAISLRDMVWAEGVARPAGDHPALEIALPRPAFVQAVRLHYVYTNAVGTPDLFEFAWDLGAGDFSKAAPWPRVLLEVGPGDAGGRTATVLVNARITAFRLKPRIKLFALRLSGVEVLLPGEATPSPSGPS